MQRLGVVLVAALALIGAAAAFSQGGTGARAGARLQVVAAENFWGSLATQLGGDRVQVTSIITSPATDPHDYEPTAADARTIAGAQMVIVNGIGYDPWAPKLIAASPAHGRFVLTVGDLVGVKAGGNPHRWYSPGNVQQVIAAIVRDYSKLDPQDAGYFQRQKTALERHGLSRYKRLIATIKRKYHGVPVGASESIFAPLAHALALELITPASFLKAISEGTEPTAKDKTTIERQIAQKQIEVWVYNSQNSTPDVKRVTDAARKSGIPVTTITETLTPATASFQGWQSRQLQALAAALAKATGR
ncbi:MAG: zinc ABC transporter solute-binding protein [Thermoleophilia bacterium]|nr:zinc ABC transporter solute-binding protein [Thermoleophilia bacterium]